MGARRGGQLARVDEQLDMAVLAQDGEAERQRRVGHVAAPDVEQPGDRIRLGENRRGDAGGVQRTADAQSLFGRVDTGVIQHVRYGGGQRRGRAIPPDRIDRVGRERDSLQSGGGQIGLKRFDSGRGMQPGVEADPRARPKRPGQPFAVGL
jgi:hypothetical protein